MVMLKAFTTMFTEEQVRDILSELYSDMGSEVDFEAFLKVSYLC